MEVPVLGVPREKNGHGIPQRQTKVIPASLEFIARLMQLDGTTVIKTKGWPKGAEIIGMGLNQKTQEFLIVVTHPTFPYLPEGTTPGRIEVTWEARKVEIKEEEPDGDGNEKA